MFFAPALKGAVCPTLTESRKRWFFARPGSVNSEEAKKFCKKCPVTKQCLELALEFESAPGERRNGVWGGLDAGERKAIFGGMDEDLQAS